MLYFMTIRSASEQPLFDLGLIKQNFDVNNYLLGEIYLRFNILLTFRGK